MIRDMYIAKDRRLETLAGALQYSSVIQLIFLN